jgi:hypothetical protein
LIGQKAKITPVEPEAAITPGALIPLGIKRWWIVHLKVKGRSRFLAL